MAAVAVADCQRVVGDEALREHLLIALARFFRFREVVREISADELLARYARYFDRAFVHIGDLAFRTDRHEGVERGFDQAAGVLCGLLLRRDIACRCEHAQHIAVDVLVYRRIVENVRQGAVLVAHSQRIVGNETVSEHLLIAFARFFRLGKVVGEVRTDQLFARYAGDFDRTLVDVGDLAFGADRNEGIERGLNQAARVAGGRTQLFLGAATFGDVAAHEQVADGIPMRVVAARNDDARVETRSVLANALEFAFRKTVFVCRLEQPAHRAGLYVLPGMQDFRTATEDLVGSVAIVAPRTFVPRENTIVEVFADDGVLDGTLQNVVEQVHRFRELSHHSLRFGNVACRRKHAENVAAGVLV